ncbi:MAG: BMC domain-containing protein [Spirochaetes bacterium]|nr:BMC domain-containing protein [Spirochaetota bacterium]
MDILVLGVLEFNSIAIGIQAMDAMVKEAPIKIIDAKTICPGKFVILISGDVASVDAGLSAGKRIGSGYIVDELFLPQVHEDIIPAITGTTECEIWDAVGVIECFSIISSIEAGDIAAKYTGVKIPEIRLAVGMGGKSFVKIIGPIANVENAMDAAVNRVKQKGLLCMSTIIPQPHPEIKPFFL